MAKYVKKPLIVEAELYRKGMEDGFDRCSSVTCGEFNNFNKKCCDCKSGKPYINTLEGKSYIAEGDYIIIGVLGEKYPCNSEVFLQTYERVVGTNR